MAKRTKTKKAKPKKSSGNKSATQKSKDHIRAVKKAAIIDSVAAGATVETAAGAAGIARKTFYEWRKKDPEFNELVERAYTGVVKSVEGALVRAATVPDKQGRVNVTAQIFYLANRAPERWRSVNRQEITGPDGGPVRMSFADFVRRATNGAGNGEDEGGK